MLVKKAQVYLLDEPTSALDIQNEKEVIEKLLAYLKHKTVLLATHRPALLKEMDHVWLVRQVQVESRAVDPAGLDEEWLYKALDPSGSIPLEAQYRVLP